MSNIEQTLSIIKPDALDRDLDNEIKEMFKIKGFLEFSPEHQVFKIQEVNSERT